MRAPGAPSAGRGHTLPEGRRCIKAAPSRAVAKPEAAQPSKPRPGFPAMGVRSQPPSHHFHQKARAQLQNRSARGPCAGAGISEWLLETQRKRKEPTALGFCTGLPYGMPQAPRETYWRLKVGYLSEYTFIWAFKIFCLFLCSDGFPQASAS